MLTVCSLPSTRKVQINNTVLDIVIPNLRTLKTFPNKALVIYIVKKTNDMNQEKINTVARFQPEYKNLWLISKRPLSSGYINYIICPEEKVIPSFERRNYRDIIVDIQKFLKETGD
jgi:agmatine/peptidylarginine deiminase